MSKLMVRRWNAYASNNSGSYTIVGVLPSAEVASELAEKLRDVVARHTAWLESTDGRWSKSEVGEASPLAQFCREVGLTWAPGRGTEDDWPQYSGDNRPEITAVGPQLVIHHPYTVTLPPTFGEVIYRYGGRVQHEEDHAHHPILTFADFYWGWKPEDKTRLQEERPRLLQALRDGPFTDSRPEGWPPAWRASDDWMAPPLVVGVVFRELLAGVSAMRGLAERHGAMMHVRLAEGPEESRDPFVHLRPSTPPVPRLDVVVEAVGADLPRLITLLSEACALPYDGVMRDRLSELPAIVVRGWSEDRAEALVAAILSTGASAVGVRNDG